MLAQMHVMEKDSSGVQGARGERKDEEKKEERKREPCF